MKKLMFAAVAGVCATVAFGDGVQSDNIVGYMDNALVDGSKAVSVPLNVVGKTVEGQKGVNLSDIVPVGADTITGEVTLQKLDASGGTDGVVYDYHKNDPAAARGKKKYPTDGWYYGTTYITPGGATDIFIPVGSGVWVSGTSTLKFTPSGEVQLDTVQSDLVAGSRLVANPYAAAVKLSAFVPTGADTITGEITLQKLSASGGTDGVVYDYHKNDPAAARGKKKYPNDGWYYGTTYITPDSADDIEIAAGAAVWVSGTAELDIQVVTPFEDL